MHDDKFTFGQQQNPLVDWEENLWGFRYTALTPWNYLSLSSTQVGVAMKGPIKFNEKQYADYDVGVYDDASFHANEESAYKQVMGRVTVNPFGANSRYDGFGLTGFYDYGYSQKCTPDSNKSNATCGHIARAAALAHYTAETLGNHRRMGLRPQRVQPPATCTRAADRQTQSVSPAARTARFCRHGTHGRRHPEPAGSADGCGLDGPLGYPAYPVHGLRPAAVVSTEHAHPEGPARLHPLRPGRAVADQQVPAGGVRFTGHPVLPQPVRAPSRIDVRALEGACRSQLRATPTDSSCTWNSDTSYDSATAGASMQNARAGQHHVPQNTSCETGSPDLCVGDADFALCVRGAERDTGSSNRAFLLGR